MRKCQRHQQWRPQGDTKRWRPAELNGSAGSIGKEHFRLYWQALRVLVSRVLARTLDSWLERPDNGIPYRYLVAPLWGTAILRRCSFATCKKSTLSSEISKRLRGEQNWRMSWSVFSPFSVRFQQFLSLKNRYCCLVWYRRETSKIHVIPFSRTLLACFGLTPLKNIDCRRLISPLQLYFIRPPPIGWIIGRLLFGSIGLLRLMYPFFPGGNACAKIIKTISYFQNCQGHCLYIEHVWMLEIL